MSKNALGNPQSHLMIRGSDHYTIENEKGEEMKQIQT